MIEFYRQGAGRYQVTRGGLWVGSIIHDVGGWRVVGLDTRLGPLATCKTLRQAKEQARMKFSK